MRVSAREMLPKSAILATRKVLKDATVKLQLVAILEVNVIGFSQCLKITQKVLFCNIASEASYV